MAVALQLGLKLAGRLETRVSKLVGMRVAPELGFQSTQRGERSNSGLVGMAVALGLGFTTKGKPLYALSDFLFCLDAESSDIGRIDQR